MKKTTGKVVSLVLALALVVTSFSATFAFAATKSETVIVTPGKTALVLSNGGATGTAAAKVSVGTLLAAGATGAETFDHMNPTVYIQEIARVSGDDVLKFTVAGASLSAAPTTADIELKSATATGTEVIAVRYAGTFTRDGETVTANGTAQVTVKVLAKDSLVIGDAAATAVEPADGSLAFTDTLAKNDTATHTYTAFTVSSQTTVASALAMYTPVTLETALGTHEPNAFGVEVNPSTSFKALALNGTAGIDVQAQTIGSEPFVRIGNYALKFTKYATATAAATGVNSSVTAVIKVANKVQLTGAQQIYAWHGATWASTNYILPDQNPTATIPEALAVNVTGTDLVLGDATTIHSGVVGAVSGAATFQVDGGVVASVASTVTTLTVNNGNVAKSAAAVNIINGGVVGDITATDSIAIDATTDTVPTVVGSLSAPSITVNSSKASVKTGAIKVAGTTGLKLSGNKTSVGTIDFNYYTAPLTLDNFVGSIASPINAKFATLVTTNSSATADSTNAVVTGAAKITNLTLNAGKILFPSSLQAGSISGSGELDVYAGKLSVDTSLIGVSLRLLDTTLKAGTVVLTAPAYKVYVGTFNTIGYTLETVSTTTTDTFKIKSVDFAGVVLNKTSDKILVGKAATYTVSAYPAGTKLPDGYTVKWDFTGDNDYFTFATTATTATVTANKYDSVFTSLNKGTVTATVLDQYGFPAYGYQIGTVDVAIVNKLDVVSDTTADFSVASGATYQFKLTASTAPSFYAGTDGIFKVALASHTGNDYFYKITATGKVGSATGIYINGNKLLVATVKAAAYKSDTTKDTTVKGAYTVKITAAATPSFAVGTAGVFSAKFVSKTGNDYLYKISSVGKVGTKAGIYVNGVKTFVGIVG